MSTVTEIQCDGCEKRTTASVDNAGLPQGWRRLRICFGNSHWTADVCSPFCASRAVDKTYEKEDRVDALRLVR